MCNKYFKNLNFIKQLVIVVFLKQEERVHLLGTIFSYGLIHILCCSEYL